MTCVICGKLPQGRRYATALTCVGDCTRKREAARVKAWRDGKIAAGTLPPRPSTAEVQRRARRRKHGLDMESASIMAESAIGVCNACGETAVLAVDHDHRHCPGKYGCAACVRGFLCSPCNLAAGSAKDDPTRLERVAAYLRETGEVYGPGF